ncbi:MAG: L-lactate dehydrogenase [Oscillospiraceae bacterium]|nr:L-lactate dehydrogenase [Oscillospiraceae bacterium]
MWKISVIGAGFVGSTTAYTLITQGLARELVLIDANRDKAEGDAMDMNHGLSFVRPVRVYAGSWADMGGSELIIVAAGAGQKPGESRTDLLRRNADVFRGIMAEVVRYAPPGALLLIVTNPVDILTYISLRLTGFPRQRVIGSGTVLDTSRLKYLIGQHAGIDARNVHTFILGEHGETEVAAWSATHIAGVPIDDYCHICGRCQSPNRICRDEFYLRTKNAAAEIIGKKGATYYAVALSVCRIVRAMTGGENTILTVSGLLDGQYGIRGVCLSLPAVVGGGGIEYTIEIPLSDGEKAGLRHSADTLRSLAAEIGF